MMVLHLNCLDLDRRDYNQLWYIKGNQNTGHGHGKTTLILKLFINRKKCNITNAYYNISQYDSFLYNLDGIMGKQYITFAGVNSVPNKDESTYITSFEVRTLDFKMTNMTIKIRYFSFFKLIRK